MNGITITTGMLPKVTHNLNTIKIDLEELKTRYETAIYDEGTISIAKKERAMLNNVIKDLDEKRKTVKNSYLEPYNEFEKEIKALEGIVRPAIENIDKQVKSFEESERAAKQTEIEGYFNSVVGEIGEFVKPEKILESKWMNKSVSMEIIKSEIDCALIRINNDLMSISDLKSDNESQLKAIYFRTLDLSNAISENARLKRETARVESVSEKIMPKPIKFFETVYVGETSAADKIDYSISFSCTKKQFSEIHSLLYSLGIKWSDNTELDF